MANDILEKAGEMLQQTKEQGLTPFDVGSALNGDTLAPEPDFDVAPVDTPTLVSGELGRMEEQAKQFTADLDKKAEKDREREESSFNQLLAAQLDETGAEEFRNNLFAKEGGVDDIELQLKEINNEILQEQVGLRRTIEEIEKNPEGKLRGAIAQDIQKARTESFRRQADLSVIQMGLQGRYDSARAIADRSVNAFVEQQQIRINALQTNYDRNKDLFNRSEQRAFESAQADRQRALDREEADLKNKSDLKLDLIKAGAPRSVLSNIDFMSYEQALNMSAPYLAPSSSSKTQIIDLNGKKYLINSQTGDVINDFGSYQGDIGVESAFQTERKQRVLASITELEDKVSSDTVGFGSLLTSLPGTPARNFKANLDSMKANIAFSELQAMRDASKTGGALGQVSERELALLEASLAGLDQGQSPAQFKQNLQKIRESLTRWHEAADTLNEEDQLRAMGYTDEQIEEIKNAP